MLVKFQFTDSPPGSPALHIVTGVFYEISDSDDNVIIQGETGLEVLDPGNYCIIASRYQSPGFILFAQKHFEILPEYPPHPPYLIPTPSWDVQITIYLISTPFTEEEGLPVEPCSELIPQPPPQPPEEEGFDKQWLWLILLVIAGGVISR